jgi:hypothetical protein
MKIEILNKIKSLGGNISNLKGVSLQDDFAAITFQHPLYASNYADGLYGIDEFFEQNKALYLTNKDTFYDALMAHFFSDHEIPYGQMLFRKTLFTPFVKGSADYDDWGHLLRKKAW